MNNNRRNVIMNPNVNPLQFINMFFNSLVNLPVYENDDFEMAKAYWHHLLSEENLNDFEPSKQIILILLDYFYESDNRAFPSRPIIVEILGSQLYETQLMFFNLPQNQVYEIVDFYVFRYGFIPVYSDLEYILEYHLIHHIYPDVEELFLSIQRRAQFTIDPDRYEQENKVIICTKNLEHLPITKSTVEHNCGLCFEQMQPGSDVYTIPPCNHTFHAHPSECIDSTVFTWLQTSNKCPLCKTEVCIKYDESLVPSEENSENTT